MNYIKVDISLIKRCIKDKELLEALAIATLFKARYANSTIYHHSAREYKEIARMGTERPKRALTKAKGVGFIRANANGLVVNKLHKDRFRYIRIERTSSFKDIVRLFREAVLKDTIGAVNHIENIANKAVSRKASRSRAAYLRRLRKLDVDLNKVERIGTISKSVLAKKVGVSKSSVSNIVRRLSKEGTIIIEHRFQMVDIVSGRISLAVLNKYNPYGFVTRSSDRLLRQLPNHYEYA